MKEPSYGYDWPEPERPPQYKYPENTSFNEYLDLYRDRKDINEQVGKTRRGAHGMPLKLYSISGKEQVLTRGPLLVSYPER